MLWAASASSSSVCNTPTCIMRLLPWPPVAKKSKRRINSSDSTLKKAGCFSASPTAILANLGGKSTARCICNCPSCAKCRLPTLPSKPRSAIKERPSAKRMARVGSVSPALFTTRYTSSNRPSLSDTSSPRRVKSAAL